MMRLKVKTVDWRFAMCPLATAAEHFGPFRELVACWQARIGPGKALPHRADFQMEDFEGWLEQIFIARIERNPFNLRFTLWGTQLVDWWQIDYTDKTLGSESLDPEAWKSSEIRYFEKMDQAPFIGVTSGKLTQHAREHIKVMAVDLPLSEGSGIDHVISAHVKIALTDEIETVLPTCPVTFL